MAALATLAVVYAMSLQLAPPEVAADETDPLDALGRGAALAVEAETAAAAPAPPSEVDPTALTFPERLGREERLDERPEVAALFAQASAELRRLEAAAPAAAPAVPGDVPPSCRPRALRPPTRDRRRVLPTTLPASVASTEEGRQLVADSADDVLLAAALPSAEAPTPGRFGETVATAFRSRPSARRRTRSSSPPV